MEKGEWLGQCFVRASGNALQNVSLNVSDNGLKNTSWEISGSASWNV